MESRKRRKNKEKETEINKGEETFSLCLKIKWSSSLSHKSADFSSNHKNNDIKRNEN